MINYYLAPWKKFAQFEGRSRRSEYWWFQLINFVIAVIFSVVAIQAPSLAILSTIFSLASLIPGIAVAVRRMHDVGKSGWFMLIPIYNIILAFTDSQPGANKYGPNPKSNELDVSDHLVT
jgi:uncharacterized membrane protein YhaH (DUF805 family)